jgi:GntR family transcriptional regulator
MLFDIHSDSTIPIYEQIVAQVIFGIASGTDEVGATIDSVRDLAKRLLVNPNTVARAFQELERSGILESKRGRGMEVTAEAPRLCRTRRQQIVSQRIREALREAVSSGLPADTIRQLVEQELQRLTRGNNR